MANPNPLLHVTLHQDITAIDTAIRSVALHALGGVRSKLRQERALLFEFVDEKKNQWSVSETRQISDVIVRIVGAGLGCVNNNHDDGLEMAKDMGVWNVYVLDWYVTENAEFGLHRY